MGASRGDQVFHGVLYRLFGGQRAKLVPWQAINDMAIEGAGFATWLDLTPAHPDLMAIPDADAVIHLP